MVIYKPGPIRLANDKIYIRTPQGEQSLDIAPLNKAVPYYRNFRRTINVKVINRWPVDVIRRFVYDFKPQIDEYISRPTKSSYSNLTNRLDYVIQRATQPPRQ